MKFFGVFILVIFGSIVNGQEIRKDSVLADPPKPRTEWYKKINVRGYTQIRYNRLFETNENLECEQCDRSWGGNGGFFLRRIRIIFFGQVHERFYVYIQPDFASSPSSSNNNHTFAQIRDAYFDLGLDKKNEFRFRIGQSKVPFGFENLQSSQNRIPLDRNDGINSAVANERAPSVSSIRSSRTVNSRTARSLMTCSSAALLSAWFVLVSLMLITFKLSWSRTKLHSCRNSVVASWAAD